MVAYKSCFALLIIGVIPLLGPRVYSAPEAFCEECAPFIPGAVAYWPMTMGTEGSDISGNENNATFVGLTYTGGPNGEDNGAVHFRGSSNSFASVINSPSMDVGKYLGFSFSGFVRLNMHFESASLIDWSSKDGYGVFIVAAPVIKLNLYPNSNHDIVKHQAEFPKHKLTNGTWHFIGLSYEKDTGRAIAFNHGKHEVLHIDKNIVPGTDKTTEVGLGVDMSNMGFNYHGDMSCMMLFKFALTADDFDRVWEFCRRRTNSAKEMLPGITVSDIATTNATVSWTKSPGIFSGYRITIERKQEKLGQEIVQPDFISSSATIRKSVLTNLVPGAYRVHVSHMQGHIKGRARSSEWFHTEPSVVVESDSIIFYEITATSAKVSWKDVTGNNDGYTVHISPTTGGARAEPSTVPRGTTHTTLLNLTAGRSYIVRIRTKIGSRMSSPSTNIFHTLEPSVVVESDSIIFYEITATSAKVSWKDVTGNNDGYTVDISPTTGGARADPSTVRGGTTNTTLLNLTAGRSYIVQIRTKIGSRTSSPSMNVFDTLGLPCAMPSSVPTTLGTTWILVINIIALVLIIAFIIAVVILVRMRTCLRHSTGNKTEDSLKMTLQNSKNEEATQIRLTSHSFSDSEGVSERMIETKAELHRHISRDSEEAKEPLLESIKVTSFTIANDLKKRYQDYRIIVLLPYRQDQVTDITQFSRNFEKETSHGFKHVILEKIFKEDDSNPKSKKRYVLEALAGYGKSSVMKKLAYTWATGNEKLNHHFKFVFLINTDDFVEFQKKAKNPTGNYLGDFVSSEYFFSDQSIESGHNRDEIWRLVQDNEENVLFIIDTNYNRELPDDLKKLFLRKTMQDSTVILTCRTNQVPTMIRDHANMFTLIRIVKHDPATIQKNILQYSESKGTGMLWMGIALLEKLGIKNMDDKAAIRDDVKLSWISTPFMLVIIINVWQDIWENGDEDEKERFCLDEPFIYQKVAKIIFKYYECCEGGSLPRVNHAVEGNTYAQETLTLGRLAWDMIVKNISSIPAEELGSLKDDEREANVLRNIGVLRPIRIAEDVIPKEKYMFTDEIWKFYFAARFLRNEMDQGKMKDKDIHNAVEMVRNLNKNIEGLFKKFIEM